MKRLIKAVCLLAAAIATSGSLSTERNTFDIAKHYYEWVMSDQEPA